MTCELDVREILIMLIQVMALVFQRSHLQVFGDVSTSSPVNFEIRWTFVRHVVAIKNFNDSGGSLALL